MLNRLAFSCVHADPEHCVLEPASQHDLVPGGAGHPRYSDPAAILSLAVPKLIAVLVVAWACIGVALVSGFSADLLTLFLDCANLSPKREPASCGLPQAG